MTLRSAVRDTPVGGAGVPFKATPFNKNRHPCYTDAEDCLSICREMAVESIHTLLLTLRLSG